MAKAGNLAAIREILDRTLGKPVSRLLHESRPRGLSIFAIETQSSGCSPSLTRSKPMNNSARKPKRWRPRFSVRTLVILVTLVCCYAACWGPTKTQGIADINSRVDSSLVQPFVPLVLRTESPYLNFRHGVIWEHYYFWFFGYIAKLPYEREIDQW